jgi:hypothetical protein
MAMERDAQNKRQQFLWVTNSRPVSAPDCGPASNNDPTPSAMTSQPDNQPQHPCEKKNTAAATIAEQQPTAVAAVGRIRPHSVAHRCTTGSTSTLRCIHPDVHNRVSPTCTRTVFQAAAPVVAWMPSKETPPGPSQIYDKHVIDAANRAASAAATTIASATPAPSPPRRCSNNNKRPKQQHQIKQNNIQMLSTKGVSGTILITTKSSSTTIMRMGAGAKQQLNNANNTTTTTTTTVHTSTRAFTAKLKGQCMNERALREREEAIALVAALPD